MSKFKYKFLLPLVAFGTLSGVTSALATPLLGPDLSSFTILGAATVTNVPTSTVVGNVGVWSSGGANAVTGFNSSPGVGVSDPQVTGGSVYAGGSLAQSAQGQLTNAITNLGLLGSGTLLAADLSGLTLMPGVYTVPAGTTNLSGALTLDGGGNANAAWVFQMPSTLITSPNSVVSLINTNSNAGVFWNVGSSATIDVNTSFLGNILALSSITLNTGATDLCGRALASTGAVTMDQNNFSGMCTGILPGTGNLSGGLDVVTMDDGTTQINTLPYETASVSEPATISLMALGLLGLGFIRRRRNQE